MNNQEPEISEEALDYICKLSVEIARLNVPEGAEPVTDRQAAFVIGAFLHGAFQDVLKGTGAVPLAFIGDLQMVTGINNQVYIQYIADDALLEACAEAELELRGSHAKH